MPLMKFLIIVCVPKPTPIASAPPTKVNTVNGIRARLRMETASSTETEIISQRRVTEATWALTLPRSTSRARMRLVMRANSQ